MDWPCIHHHFVVVIVGGAAAAACRLNFERVLRAEN